MANCLKQRELSSIISAIRTEEGVLEVKSVILFREFYISLYKADNQQNGECMETFLQGLELPKLSESQRANLDCPITKEEIISVIQEQPSGKAPGPDGFTAVFFKSYFSELTPLLLSMYNEAFEKGQLPHTLSKALITLILKKDKDP